MQCQLGNEDYNCKWVQRIKGIQMLDDTLLLGTPPPPPSHSIVEAGNYRVTLDYLAVALQMKNGLGCNLFHKDLEFNEFVCAIGTVLTDIQNEADVS
jgi:hypothetical protein